MSAGEKQQETESERGRVSSRGGEEEEMRKIR